MHGFAHTSCWRKNGVFRLTKTPKFGDFLPELGTPVPRLRADT
jgi:hypothetical protein